MHWQLQEAKQRLSELIRAAQTDGVQFITKHNKETVVVMSMGDYLAMRGDQPNFLDFLSEAPDFDQLDLTRSKEMPRDVDLEDW